MPKDPDAEASGNAAPADVALIHGVTASGDMRILRKRADRLEVDAVKQLREGTPITGKVVKLTPRREFPLLCDVETVLPSPAPLKSDVAADGPRKGPAQVATERYRDNWESIWGRAPDRGAPN
jgi:hypothetical protein